MSIGSVMLSRQWVPMAGGSCDLRMGVDALEQSGKLFRDSVSRARACMIITAEGTDEEREEMLRRQLTDSGFTVNWHRVDPSQAATIAEAERLFGALGKAGVTADDLCVAMGDEAILALSSFVCDHWCGGTSLVAIPTDEAALMEGVLCPRPLDACGHAGLVTVRPCARHALLDYSICLSAPDDESARYMRVLMVATAMGSTEREFSALWDRAPSIMDDDVETYVSQIIATAKARGKASSSATVAIRQSTEYGKLFADALGQLASDAAPSALLAEGLRFAARVSVAEGKLSIDDMLAQDELLDVLGIGSLRCDVDPNDLIDALKSERFRRSNRFLLLAPHAIGRVRPMTVDDDLLAEHARAWCAAHAS